WGKVGGVAFPMGEIKTAQWVETLISEEEPRFTSTLRHWIRIDPPAHAWKSELGSHDVIDERGHLHTADTWDHCSLSPPVAPWTRESRLRMVSPTLRPAEREAHAAPSDQLLDPWHTERTQVGDRPAILYRCRYASGSFQVTALYWLDPETRL